MPAEYLHVLIEIAIFLRLVRGLAGEMPRVDDDERLSA